MIENTTRHLHRAGPYLSLGNLIALLGLLVMLGLNYFNTNTALKSQVSVNTAEIANIKQRNGWQDVALANTTKHTDKKLQILDNKVTHVLDLLIKAERERKQ
jgi:hypothetical protein